MTNRRSRPLDLMPAAILTAALALFGAQACKKNGSGTGPSAPTLTPTATVNASATGTPSPTSSPTPSSTRTQADTPTPTPTPSPSPTGVIGIEQILFTYSTGHVASGYVLLNVMGTPVSNAAVTAVSGGVSVSCPYTLTAGSYASYYGSNIPATPGAPVTVFVAAGGSSGYAEGDWAGEGAVGPLRDRADWNNPADIGYLTICNAPTSGACAGGNTYSSYASAPATEILIPVPTAYPTPSTYLASLTVDSYMRFNNLNLAYGMYGSGRYVYDSYYPAPVYTPTATPTCAPSTFGRTTATSTGQLRSGLMAVSAFTCPGGVLKSISFRVDAFGTNNQCRAAVYYASGPNAGQLAVQSAARTITTGMNVLTVGAVTLSAGTYDLALKSNSNSVSIGYQPGGGNNLLGAASAWGAFPNPIPVLTPAPGELCINAQYCP